MGVQEEKRRVQEETTKIKTLLNEKTKMTVHQKKKIDVNMCN